MTDPVDLPRAIMAAIPGTMQELGGRTGVEGEELWVVVREMRSAGFLRRTTGRVFVAGRKPLPADWNLAPDVLAAARAKGGKRRLHTIVVSLPDWPLMEPGREMVFDSHGSAKTAGAELQRLVESVPEARWRVAPMTKREQIEMQNKPVPANGADDARQAGEGRQPWRRCDDAAENI